MAVDFLNIPGDIRQQYMPFTIGGPGKKQLFTYKEGINGNVAVIHPFSKHLQTLIANDSSFQYTHGDKDSTKKIEYKDFLNAMPGIQIREFVPDAKLTQTFKWFSYLKQGFDAAMKTIETEAAGNWAAAKKKLNDAWTELGEKMQGLTSGNAPILAEVAAGLTHYYRDRGFGVGPDKGFAVLFIPFLLYYRLTTTHTNNIYEIPFSMKNSILESDGTYGWGDDRSDFPLIDAIGSKFTGAAAALMPGLGSTIKVNAMPSFNPSGSARSTEFTISFDLINDSDEAAVNNFLMCHTLFGNNRWLQYGFVQTGASLYDVKLPGANRYFMCSGRFLCKGKGGFRTPSSKVIEDIVGHHGADLAEGHRIQDKNNKNGWNDEVLTALSKDAARQKAHDALAAEDNASIQGSKRAVVSPISSTVASLINAGKKVYVEAANTKAFSAVNGFLQKAKYNSEAIEAIRKEQDARKRLEDSNKTIVELQTERASLLQEFEEGVRMQEEVKDFLAPQIRLNEFCNPLVGPNSSGPLILRWKKEIDKDEFGTEFAYLRLQYELKDGAHLSEEQLKTFNKLTSDYDMFLNENLNGGVEKRRNLAISNSQYAEGYNHIWHSKVYINGSEHMLGINEKIVVAETARDAAMRDLKEVEEEQYFKDVYEKELEKEKQQVLSQASGKVNASDNIWRDLIKIPDVYSIELTFSSLLPDNFNNYLYGWRADNLDPIENYFKGSVDEVGAMEKLVQNLIKAVGAKGGG